jgi:tetratricopeptide (TPR) repeat protein
LKGNDPTAKQRLADARQKQKSLDDQAKLEQDFKSAMTGGDDAMRVGDYPKAIQSYERATQLKGNDPTARLRLADARQKQKSLDDQAKLEQDFKSAMAGGDDAMRVGDYPKAIQSYERATQLKGNDPTARLRLADARQKQESLDNQAKLEQDFKSAMTGGDDAVRLGDYPKAIQSYERATQLKGNDPTAQQRLADARQKQKSLDDQAKLEQDFKSAMAAGDEALRLGDYPKAIQNYERATQLKKNDGIAQQRLADARQRQNDAQVQGKIDQPQIGTRKPVAPTSVLDQLDKELAVWEVMLGSRDPSPEIVYTGKAPLSLLRSAKPGVQAEKIRTDMGRSGRQFVQQRIEQIRAQYEANGWLDTNRGNQITELLQKKLPNFQ